MDILTEASLNDGRKKAKHRHHGVSGLPIHFLILLQIEKFHVCLAADRLGCFFGMMPREAWALARLASTFSHRWNRPFSENIWFIASAGVACVIFNL
jgi:hypothetical protein